MKQVMCGKMTPVAYQNVDIGKGPGTVVYKVGPKAGLQQCSTVGGGGADGGAAAFKLSNHLETDSAAAWNIIALSMCIRSQSPDSNACVVLAPLSSSHLNSASLRTTEGEKLSHHACTPTLYPATNFSKRLSAGQAVGDHDSRNSFATEGKKIDTGLHNRISSGSRSSWSNSPDSSDEDKSCLSHFGEHSWGEGDAKLTLPYQSRWGSSGLLDSTSQHPNLGLEHSSSSSSSIGECEDSSCSSLEASNEASTSGEMEVESAPRGGPLNHMSALESSLPIKRGLSKFWSGKARSFTSLAAVSSMEDLAKPEDPYARRRRITSSFGDRHKSFPPLSRSSTAGISKKPTSNSGSRSGLAMAFAMGSKFEEAPKLSPPLHAAPKHSVRSMSLTDLADGSSFQYSNARSSVTGRGLV